MTAHMRADSDAVANILLNTQGRRIVGNLDAGTSPLGGWTADGRGKETIMKKLAMTLMLFGLVAGTQAGCDDIEFEDISIGFPGLSFGYDDRFYGDDYSYEEEFYVEDEYWVEGDYWYDDDEFYRP